MDGRGVWRKWWRRDLDKRQAQIAAGPKLYNKVTGERQQNDKTAAAGRGTGAEFVSAEHIFAVEM